MRFWRDTGEAMTEAMNANRVVWYLCRPGREPEIVPREANPRITSWDWHLWYSGGKIR